MKFKANLNKKKGENQASQNETKEIKTTVEFYLEDFNRTLFPLRTNKILIENGESEIKSYIEKCLDKQVDNYNFSPQSRVYAAKSGFHLRRTVKLDVAAEYYLYDLIYRNKKFFRKPHKDDRRHYGYRFENSATISPAAAYSAFKAALSQFRDEYDHSVGFDIASYFNGIYHHDLVAWFSELGVTDADSDGLGQLLRQINYGRSIDCLPQGLYPTKMLGNDFLRFVENHHEIRSEKLVRFMDDIYIFSDDKKKLEADFQTVQKLLGEKGLSVNPSKTKFDSIEIIKFEGEIGSVKKQLLKRRKLLAVEGYDEDGDIILKEMLVKHPLNPQEVLYINNLLNQGHIEEEDAELILSIVYDNTENVEKRLPYILSQYPHLSKSVYSFCSRVKDREKLAEIVIDQIESSEQLMEFQLFWFGVMLEDYLINTSRASEIISKLFSHKSATSVSKAKILEINDKRFGLTEIRDTYLANGQSDWLAWSSAVGALSLKPNARNHKIKYFGNSSNMNNLVATIVSKIS